MRQTNVTRPKICGLAPFCYLSVPPGPLRGEGIRNRRHEFSDGPHRVAICGEYQPCYDWGLSGDDWFAIDP